MITAAPRKRLTGREAVRDYHPEIIALARRLARGADADDLAQEMVVASLRVRARHTIAWWRQLWWWRGQDARKNLALRRRPSLEQILESRAV
jgi:DNA-directed RNA polymerase specialized sigma24 family protein